MPDIVICEFMDDGIARDVLDGFELKYDPTLVDDRERLLEALVDARAIVVRNRTQVDGELLERAPSLIVVGRLGVGLDNIDLGACKKRGVAVCPATGANDIAVAEYAVSAMLMLLRGAWQAGDRMVSGDWPRTEMIGREASGKQLGLIGFGSIARNVASRAAALGMSVATSDPYVAKDDPALTDVQLLDIEALAKSSDVISVHVPLTDETRHLVDGSFLKRMRKGSVLINTARGGVVDDNAVVAALRSGHLGGAALDVFETEPLDADAGRLFAGVPNLLLTPHIAGITDEANQRVSRVTAENVRRHLDGF